MKNLFIHCFPPLHSEAEPDQHRPLCRSPRGRKERKQKGHGIALLSVDPRTGNATTTCPFLEAVCLLMLPLKFSNFTLQLQLSCNATAKSKEFRKLIHFNKSRQVFKFSLLHSAWS